MAAPATCAARELNKDIKSYERDQPRGPAGCTFYLCNADDERCAGCRHLVEVGDVLQPPAPRRQPGGVNLEILRRTNVERKRVGSEADHLALLHQPIDRVR